MAELFKQNAYRLFAQALVQEDAGTLNMLLTTKKIGFKLRLSEKKLDASMIECLFDEASGEIKNNLLCRLAGEQFGKVSLSDIAVVLNKTHLLPATDLMARSSHRLFGMPASNDLEEKPVTKRRGSAFTGSVFQRKKLPTTVCESPAPAIDIGKNTTNTTYP